MFSKKNVRLVSIEKQELNSFQILRQSMNLGAGDSINRERNAPSARRCHQCHESCFWKIAICKDPVAVCDLKQSACQEIRREDVEDGHIGKARQQASVGFKNSDIFRRLVIR